MRWKLRAQVPKLFTDCPGKAYCCLSSSALRSLPLAAIGWRNVPLDRSEVAPKPQPFSAENMTDKSDTYCKMRSTTLNRSSQDRIARAKTITQERVDRALSQASGGRFRPWTLRQRHPWG